MRMHFCCGRNNRNFLLEITPLVGFGALRLVSNCFCGRNWSNLRFVPGVGETDFKTKKAPSEMEPFLF